MAHPLSASPDFKGFPMTIFSSGTPAYELISITEVEGHELPESWIKVSQFS